MKVVIWMNVPSHHQSDFFHAIYKINPEFQAIYYEDVLAERINMGWSSAIDVAPYELFLKADIYSLEKISNWKNSIHIIPGYGTKFLRQLIKYFSENGVNWVHWSEKSRPGWRWLASYSRKRWYASMVNRHALGALAIGSSAADDFAHWGVRSDRTAFLPYSIAGVKQVTVDMPIFNFRGDRRAFLFVGSLYHGKGIDLLLNAFAKAALDHPDWCLILVGNDRSNGKYLKKAADLGLTGRILFRGVISASEIGSAYRAADVLVLPSRYDGWGMVVNEAAAMGLPLIVSDAAGAAWHMVDHAVNGFRVRSGQVAALHDAMLTYMRSPALLPVHGEASKRIFDGHSSEVMAKRFLAILQTWQAARQ